MPDHRSDAWIALEKSSPGMFQPIAIEAFCTCGCTFDSPASCHVQCFSPGIPDIIHDSAGLTRYRRFACVLGGVIARTEDEAESNELGKHQSINLERLCKRVT